MKLIEIKTLRPSRFSKSQRSHIKPLFDIDEKLTNQ